MSSRKAPLTEKQKEAQKRFAMAVALAKNALTGESGKKRFEDMARQQEKESAYSAAVSYFMNHEE
jgi:hypothetical protein